MDWVARLNKDRLFSFQAAIWRIISSDIVKIVLLLGRFVLETIRKKVFSISLAQKEPFFDFLDAPIPPSSEFLEEAPVR